MVTLIYQTRAKVIYCYNSDLDFPLISWILKHSESASVCAPSDTPYGWSRKVFLYPPPNQSIYYVDVDGLGISIDITPSVFECRAAVEINGLFFHIYPDQFQYL